MEFSNQFPTGETDPRLTSATNWFYFESIEVKVYNQDDQVGGNTWILGDIGVPRWKHTFTSRGSEVYKPSDGDNKRYKAWVTGKYVSKTRSSPNAPSWDVAEKGTFDARIEWLRDGGQTVAILPFDGNPRNIVLQSSVAGPEPSLMAVGGTVYLINSNGNLVRYNHDTSGVFTNYLGNEIGWGWGGSHAILPVRDNGLYVVTSTGDLRYYHHDAAGNWDDINGRSIGNGWLFPWVGAGRFGQLYAVDNNGDLLYYTHDNNFNWINSGKKIGSGFAANRVFAGGKNAIYLVDTNGDLLHYYHDNNGNWQHQALKIGVGWGGFTSLRSSGNGEIYAVSPNGDLHFYRHDANNSFIAGSGRSIGWGWGNVGRFGAMASAR